MRQRAGAISRTGQNLGKTAPRLRGWRGGFGILGIIQSFPKESMNRLLKSPLFIGGNSVACQLAGELS